MLDLLIAWRCISAPFLYFFGIFYFPIDYLFDSEVTDPYYNFGHRRYPRGTRKIQLLLVFIGPTIMCRNYIHTGLMDYDLIRKLKHKDEAKLKHLYEY